MSTTIDQKVVEMRFDSKQFQAGVADTLTSLDKLDKRLQLKEASKGLESVTKAAKRVDLSSIGDSADKIGLRFDAMYTMADQALRNITNSAMAAGKRIVSALTIDPIKTGFQEYETQINAVQTILANTQSKGTTLDQVNAALDELNKYADQTIYNFTEMTRNIGTFTAAGVGLETSVQSIKGIANLAAVSGSNAQQASTAMYQLSQALASGTVKLMDWNSVVNAGMGGQVFQDALKETARVHGIAIDDMIKKEGSFRETLSSGWMTSEILNETLEKFTQTTEGLTDAEIKANRERWKSLGYTEEQIDGIFELGKTATNAATKVKTFTQLWDVLKESAQSGWSQTWKLIFGDFEEARSLFTPIADVLTTFINGISDARNTLLKSALSSPFKDLAEKLKNVTKPIDDVNKKLKDFDDIVNKVIRGDLGNMQTRFDKLTEMGYDWAHVQNLVNEKLGNSNRYATDYKETQEKLTEQTVELTDAKLKEIGLTEEEIKLYRDLEKQAKASGVSVTELINSMDQMDGRTMLIESFKNVGSGLLGVLKAIGSAWSDIFSIEPLQLYNFIKGFNELTSSLRLTDKETGELNETGQKIQRTFKGIFAALDIVLTIVSGPIKIAFKIFNSILGAAGMTILDFTAFIGDGIVKVRDFIDSIFDFGGIFDWAAPYIQKMSDAVRKWIDTVKPSEKIVDIFDKISSAIGRLSKAIWNSDLSQSIYSGLTNGLKSGAKAIWDAMIDIGRMILDAIKSVLGIHSPSTEFFEIGKNIIAGLLNGLRAGIVAIGDVIQDICSKLFGAFDKIDLSKISTVFTQIARLFPQFKIFTYSSAIINIFKELGGNISEGLANGISGGASGVFAAIVSIATGLIDTIKNVLGIHSPSRVFLTIGKFLIAGLIVGIVGSKTGLFDALKDVAGTVINFFKEYFSKLVAWFKGLNLPEIKWEHLLGIGVIVGLVATIIKVLKIFELFGEGVKGFGKMCSSAGGLMSALTKKLEGNLPKKGKIESIADTMLKFSIAIAILSASVYALAQLDYGKLWSAVGAVATLGVVVIGLSLALKAVSSSDPVAFGKFALCVLAIGGSVLLLAKAIQMMESISPGSLKKSIQVIGLLMVFMTGFSLLSKIGSGSIKGVMTTLIGMAIAIRLLVGTMKIIDGMTPESLKKGVQVIGALMAFMAVFTLLSSIGGGSYKGLGSTLRNMSISLLILVGVIKIIDGMSPESLKKGIQVIGVLMAFMATFALVTSLSKGVSKVGRTLFAMSAALLILVGVIKLIDGMSPATLIKGGIVIAALMTFMALFVAAVGDSGKFEKVGRTLFAMSAAIAILVGTMFVISLLSPEAIAKGMIVVLGLGVLLRALLIAAKGFENCKGSMIAMAAAIGILAASVVVLSFIDPKKLGNAIVALGTLMGMFALIVKSASNMNASVGALIAMTVAIGFLTTAILLVARLPVESALTATASLSILLLSFAASLKILNNMHGLSGKALLSIGVMTLVVIALAGILYLLNGVDSEHLLIKVASLSGLLLALSASMFIISKIPVAGAAYGIAGLAIVIGGLAAIIAILGGLNQIPGFSWLMGEGTKVLGQIGYAIGNFVGSIIGGFSAGATSGLPQLGQNLSDFMTSMQPFIDGIKGLDPSILSGVKALGEAVLTLTAANFLDSITSWITGGSSLSDFGTQLSSFADSFKLFSDKVSGIDESAIAKTTLIASAMKALTEMADAIPNSGGVVGWFMGENDIDTFGAKLASFAGSFVLYSNSAAGINDTVVAKTSLIFESMKMLNEMASAIPNSGGVVGWFMGENDLDGFGAKLASFGMSFTTYSTNVAGVSEDVVTKTNLVCEAMKALNEMAEAIPNSGGVAGWFAGNNDLDTFGTQLVSFAKSFTEYSGIINGIQAGNMSAVTNIMKDMVGISKDVDKIDSDGLEDFGEGMIDLGEAISDFSSKINKAKINNIGPLTTNLKSLYDFVNGMAKIDTSGVSKFTQSLKELGEISVSELVKSFSGAGTKVGQAVSQMMSEINDAVNAEKSSITAAFTSLIQPALSAITSAKGSFYKAGGDLMVGFTTGIGSQSGYINQTIYSAVASSVSGVEKAKTGFRSSGEELMHELSAAIKATSSKASAAVESVVNKAVAEIRNKYINFYNSGKYLVEGFAKGITDNTYKAAAKAREMAKAAELAAKEELDQNSPSKKFIKIGEGTTEGMVKGIEQSTPDAEKAGRNMAKATLEATQDELDINSPSVVFSEEVGRYIVQGVADGIKSDMSAEEAAEKKAQNIVSAFQNEFDRLTMADEDLDLRIKLGWTTDDSAKVERQSKRVTLAADKYAEMVSYFGSSSKEAKEAHNEWLQTQIDLNEKTNTNSFEWIEKYSYKNRETLESDLKHWKQMQSKYMEGTKERIVADNKVVEIQTTLRQLLSPSQEMDAYYRIMSRNAEGTEAYGQAAEGAAECMAQINKEVAGLEHSKNWIADRSSDNVSALKDELAMWTKIQNGCKEGSKQYDIAGKEMVRINKLLAATLKPEDEVAAWLRVVSRCTEGTEEWAEATENLLAAQKKLDDGAFQHSMDWIDDQTNLIKAYFGAKRVIERESYNTDSDNYKSAVSKEKELRDKLMDINKNYYEDLKDIQEDAANKREELDKDYNDKCEDRNEQLKEDIKSLNDAYDDALKSRTDSIYGSYGLFDKAKGNKYVSGTALIENLQSQVDQLGIWRDDLNELTSKGIDNDLVEELRAMGPSAASQIEALNGLTSSELDQYVKLWRKKHAMAKDQATYELEGLRKETNDQIIELRREANKELEEYKKTWLADIDSLNAETDTKIKDLTKTWLEDIGVLKQSTELLFENMVDNIIKTVGGETGDERAGKWSVLGANIVTGILKGIGDKSSLLTSKMQEIAKSMLNTFGYTIDSHSPSREFAKYGRYIDEGLIMGIDKYASKVSESTSDLGTSAINSLRNTIAKLGEAVENEMDAEPTIRPVLDLTNIKSGIQGINNMFSRSQALSINSSMNRRLVDEDQNGDNLGNKNTGNTYTFTQNNYSPKPLSKIDIYRQTKNQFSAMKGLVKS